MKTPDQQRFCKNGKRLSLNFEESVKCKTDTEECLLSTRNRTVNITCPNFQQFLVSLCEIGPKQSVKSAWGLKYPRCNLVPEVQEAFEKLISGKIINANEYDLAINISVLKEYLRHVEGGFFDNLSTEFYAIPMQSPLDITLIYLHSIVHELSYTAQQSTYLMCKALDNLLQIAGGQTIANYTNLLMQFVPTMFPDAVPEISKLLICARLLLVMIENRRDVFLPLPVLDESGNWFLLNSESEENNFEAGISYRLRRLEAKLVQSLDSGIDLEEQQDQFFLDAPTSEEIKPDELCHHQSLSMPDLYRLTYIDIDV